MSSGLCRQTYRRSPVQQPQQQQQSPDHSSSPPESPMSTSSDQSSSGLNNYWDPYSSASDLANSNGHRQQELYQPQNYNNQLKRSSSDSDMQVATSGYPTSSPYHRINKQPRYATKYDEMLQPLSPVTTLPVETSSSASRKRHLVSATIHKTHQSPVDAALQKQFHSLLSIASNVLDIEDFLAKHSENVDINEYNEEGRTALQQSCFDGNLALAQLLVRFGADSRLTTREGFSALHIAAFSGHSDVLLYIMSLKHR